MYIVNQQRPDCRVFIKRLITPNPLYDAKSMSPLTEEFKVAKAFNNYYPEKLRKNLLDKYMATCSYAAKTSRMNFLNEQINILKSRIVLTYLEQQQLYAYQWELGGLQLRSDTVLSLYEPVLMEIVKGVVSVNTTVMRTGTGSASITIKLPLEENGFYENILFAITSDEMWNLNTISANISANTGQYISSRQFSIFKNVYDADGKYVKTNRRECSLQPTDMIQIWFSKRYIDGTNDPSYTTEFPKDYAPGFTGFIKGTAVNYTGGQKPSYSITIDIEDVGRVLRTSRANIDPAVDPAFRPAGMDVTVWQNKMTTYGDQPTGSQLIKDVIKGKPGFWWGVSQIEVLDDMKYNKDTGIVQRTTTKDSAGTSDNGVDTSKRIVVESAPWEFDKLPLNTFDDMIGAFWKPYVAAFKQSFKLWESEYKYRWEICREIADVMEFEFYADQYGVINYHPPLYNLNPQNMKYFIANKDVKSESFKFDESTVVTSVEIVAQPSFNAIGNYVKLLSSFASAATDMLQRFGVRFRSKNIPVLSGTEPDAKTGPGSETMRNTRYLFGRAWLNRRNAEVKSGTVTLPGTPELNLCNVVLFVDDMNDFVKSINSFTNLSADVKPIIDDLDVYYISAISHGYTQGSNFTTTLTLTHGRKWSTDFGVGYSYSTDESDALLQGFRQLFLKEASDGTQQLANAIKAGPTTIGGVNPVFDSTWGRATQTLASPAGTSAFPLPSRSGGALNGG